MLAMLAAIIDRVVEFWHSVAAYLWSHIIGPVLAFFSGHGAALLLAAALGIVAYLAVRPLLGVTRDRR